MHGVLGRVGSPPSTLFGLSLLLKEALELPRVSRKFMQKLLGLLIHPLQHRREFMSALHSVFLWVDGLPDDWVSWAREPWEDLVGVLLLLPLTFANARWPISEKLSATDATLPSGGVVETTIPESLAERLYAFGEHRGEYVRLDKPPPEESPLPDPAAQNVLHDLVWGVG